MRDWRLTLCRLLLRTAKKSHPDLNKQDPQAAERFKGLTEAYTRTLAKSNSRGQYDPGAGASSSTTGPRSPRWEGRPRTRGAAPASQHVDPRRYNVREWEKAHYGMHGGAAPSGVSHRTSDMARQMQRKARAWRENPRAPPRQTTLGQLAFAVAAFTTVWTLVLRTAQTYTPAYNPTPPRRQR